jgi:hypothetical protein
MYHPDHFPRLALLAIVAVLACAGAICDRGQQQ